MNTPYRSNSNYFADGRFPMVLVVVSLAAIGSSFVLANSELEYVSKIQGFLAIVVIYLAVCLAVYLFNTRGGTRSSLELRPDPDSSEIDAGLRGIEEASRFFSGSLNSADMFRLVSSRANDVLPFSTSVLLVPDHSTYEFRVLQAHGENADRFMRLSTPMDNGIVGQCLAAKMIQIERGVTSTAGGFPAEIVSGFRSSAAIPLMRSGEVLAVLQLYSTSGTAFDGQAMATLEAIRERVTPLILSSLSFEKSMTNALTDPITDLPNERAFMLVLENQIAESQRNPEHRPLTILAMDIKEFDELNSKYGHATGDRVLGMVASSIKGQLRQMDFFARASNDEFLAILPTANDRIAEEVIARINTGIFNSKFSVTENDTITPKLNFGIAAFGIDGDAAEALIRAARLRKQQAKSDLPPKVLWFPREIVN
ncbi:MAG: GGDEF domain-containing protein [Pyrinomonadaceae bacterium]|nr:GGDEF domain-containing protein [Pyrinomonadaceae bacterium]MBP6212539.1 GGDEF domain-containing protein [Pyrinomonadaceae bacterium]